MNEYNMISSPRQYIQTWAEIDLDNLQYNLNKIKGLISPDIGILATVKANAYGHGIVKVSKFLKDEVDVLGVASLNEAVKLKKENINTDILIMGNTLTEGLKLVIDNDIAQTITDEKTAKMLNKIASKKDKQAKVHIKIDTGMGRLGFWHNKALEKIEKISNFKNIRIEGLFTHLSSAESDKEFTLKQLKRFNKAVKQVRKRKIDVKYIHAANSMAALFYEESHFNLIRPGLIIYGVYPDPQARKRIDIKPVLSLKSKISYVKEVKAGRSISYGRLHITDKKSTIATVPIGYADGYTHLLTGKAKVLIKGNLVPVVGKICMDHIMIDVTGIKDVQIGNTVTLIGKDGENSITAESIAGLIKTIPYEVLCWISNRVKRIYKSS